MSAEEAEVDGTIMAAGEDGSMTRAKSVRLHTTFKPEDIHDEDDEGDGADDSSTSVDSLRERLADEKDTVEASRGGQEGEESRLLSEMWTKVLQKRNEHVMEKAEIFETSFSKGRRSSGEQPQHQEGQRAADSTPIEAADAGDLRVQFDKTSAIVTTPGESASTIAAVYFAGRELDTLHYDYSSSLRAVLPNRRAPERVHGEYIRNAESLAEKFRRLRKEVPEAAAGIRTIAASSSEAVSFSNLTHDLTARMDVTEEVIGRFVMTDPDLQNKLYGPSEDFVQLHDPWRPEGYAPAQNLCGLLLMEGGQQQLGGGRQCMQGKGGTGDGDLRAAVTGPAIAYNNPAGCRELSLALWHQKCQEILSRLSVLENFVGSKEDGKESSNINEDGDRRGDDSGGRRPRSNEGVLAELRNMWARTELITDEREMKKLAGTLNIIGLDLDCLEGKGNPPADDPPATSEGTSSSASVYEGHPLFAEAQQIEGLFNDINAGRISVGDLSTVLDALRASERQFLPIAEFSSQLHRQERRTENLLEVLKQQNSGLASMLQESKSQQENFLAATKNSGLLATAAVPPEGLANKEDKESSQP